MVTPESQGLISCNLVEVTLEISDQYHFFSRKVDMFCIYSFTKGLT